MVSLVRDLVICYGFIFLYWHEYSAQRRLLRGQLMPALLFRSSQG